MVVPSSPASKRRGLSVPAARTTLQERVASAVLEAAAEVFAEEGPDASMAVVASAAGVARATLYRYFPNREALLAEVGDRGVAAAGARIAAARLDRVDAPTAIERTIRALVDTGAAFVVIAREGAGNRPSAYEAEIGQPLRQAFERGQASGELRRDLASAFLADALVGLIAGVLRASGSLGREEVAASTARVFIDGVRGKPRPGPADG